MTGRQERLQKTAPEVDTQALIDEGVGRLLSELAQGKSEHLEKYLAFAARFRQYSSGNQMLIFMQCPQATRVAGYRTWQELGYQVAKGQKGIRILAPRPYTRRDEKGEEAEAVYFVDVSVFDASQLVDIDKRPVPAFFTPLADDQQELCSRLEQAIRAEGIKVSEEWTGLAQGESSHYRIAVTTGLASRNKFFTLIHEYTHELLHWDEAGHALPREVSERQAEAVAYVVSHHFGIHNPFSSDYLLNWGTTPNGLIAELETVRKTAGYIIDRIEKPEAKG